MAISVASHYQREWGERNKRLTLDYSLLSDRIRSDDDEPSFGFRLLLLHLSLPFRTRSNNLHPHLVLDILFLLLPLDQPPFHFLTLLLHPRSANRRNPRLVPINHLRSHEIDTGIDDELLSGETIFRIEIGRVEVTNVELLSS